MHLGFGALSILLGVELEQGHTLEAGVDAGRVGEDALSASKWTKATEEVVDESIVSSRGKLLDQSWFGIGCWFGGRSLLLDTKHDGRSNDGVCFLGLVKGLELDGAVGSLTFRYVAIDPETDGEDAFKDETREMLVGHGGVDAADVEQRTCEMRMRSVAVLDVVLFLVLLDWLLRGSIRAVLVL